ncbi:MAG: DUF3307 domain-containing protein [Sulfitobacter sp.]
MNTTLTTVLVLLVLLQVKHLFADFFLQTPRMLSAREVYLNLGRIQHAGLHALFSLVAFCVIGAPIAVAFVICLIEWAVHFHIDWAKGRYTARRDDTPADAAYWRAFGLDQLVHQLTYVAMIWAWAVYAI